MNLQANLKERVVEILIEYERAGNIPEGWCLIQTGIEWIDGKWVLELSLQSKENYKEIKFFTYAKI